MNVDMAFSPEGRIMSFFLVLPHRMDAQYSSDCKESACNAGDTGDMGSIPSGEDSLEKGMATHSSILA